MKCPWVTSIANISCLKLLYRNRSVNQSVSQSASPLRSRYSTLIPSSLRSLTSLCSLISLSSLPTHLTTLSSLPTLPPYSPYPPYHPHQPQASTILAKIRMNCITALFPHFESFKDSDEFAATQDRVYKLTSALTGTLKVRTGDS